MTGLLAFNDGLQRRTSTGTMGLPKSLTRTQSLNAKYDRMLGSTQSIRTGKGSRKILAEVGNQFRLSGEEKNEKVQRDNAEIYRKLGIKMPAKGSREMDTGMGVMDRLDRYRLGNIPPPHGNTPPVELDEKLRKILYPSPPPPAPLTPTPPPIQLYSEQHYYPTGSRVGQRMQAVHPQTPQFNNRHEAPPQTQSYPLPPPPPFHVGGPIPPGWVYTPANGWIFVPPTQSYPTPHHGYFPVPPPPLNAPSYQGHLAYPSPYSDEPSCSEDNSSPLRQRMNDRPAPIMIPRQHDHSHPPGQEDFDPREPQPYDRRAVHDDSHPHAKGRYPSHVPSTGNRYISPRQEPNSYPAAPEYFDDSRTLPTYHTPAQTRSYPKGILRDSSSESSGHGRFVKFRETPDYAYPEKFAHEAEESREQGSCSPPQWKLRKTKAIPQFVPREEEEGGRTFQMGNYPEDGNENDTHDVPDLDIPEGHTSPLRGRGQNIDEIPAMLASVHQQLLSGHGVPSGAKASGKRSGRDLVRNLESLAEIQVEMKEQPQDDPPEQNILHRHATTPRRQVSTEDRSPFPDHGGMEREQPVSAGRIIRQGRMGDRSWKYEETEMPENRQSSPQCFEFDTPRLQDPGLSRPTPRSKGRIEFQIPSLPIRQIKTPSPAEGDEQVLPRHQPQTSIHPSHSRNISTNGRLPPPSQIWRESQRPQMAFSQNESMASQDMGSQQSNRDVSQDRPSVLVGKKRARQEWRDDEDEEDHQGGSQPQEGGNQSREVQGQDRGINQYSYSSDQDSQDPHANCNSSQARSFESAGSQIQQEHYQARGSQERRSRSSPVPAPTPRPPHHRHRLTDLQIPDHDDPSDESYRPSQPEEEEEFEYNYSQSRSISPEEPEAKRIKLTEGAWAKYDIPQDKLPIPKQTHVPFLQAYNKSRFSHHNKNKNQIPMKSRNEVNDENIKSSQTQSQISQIENSDDEMDNWMNEDIEESWSQILSDLPERDVRGEKALSTIVEDSEEEDEEQAGVEQVANDGKRGNARWVEEGFFGDGGNKGFEIWRDRY